MAGRIVRPLDPYCPEVIRRQKSMDDPITELSGVGDEIWEEFEKKHSVICNRCIQYGLINISVEY